jgi:lysophospholipase L1-like esterase
MSGETGASTPARVLVPTPPSAPSALKRLNRLAANLPRAADVILVGDSLAAGWPTDLIAEPGQQVFNFGLPGDRIQHTLWRLDFVPLAHLRPERVVILLGTNNLGDGDAPDAIAAGLQTVIDRVRDLWGQPDCVLVTIPRRGPRGGFREADRLLTNALLARGAGTSGRTHLLNADLALRIGAAGLPQVTEPDLLHLSREGYRRLGAALKASNTGAAAGHADGSDL